MGVDTYKYSRRNFRERVMIFSLSHQYFLKRLDAEQVTQEIDITIETKFIAHE